MPKQHGLWNQFLLLLLTSNESVSGIILEIKTDDYITFKHDILGDTIRISYDQVKTILHKKKKLDPVLRANYLGDYHYFSVGPGGGISYGGLGVRIQYRVGRRFGLGLHVGGGITLESFFKADPYYNMGMKFFFLTYAYLDFSYGITGTSYKKIPPYLNGNEIAINSTGFSALIGTDYFINKYFGVNIAFGLVIPTKKLKYGPQYVFDAGVVFKFPLRKHKK